MLRLLCFIVTLLAMATIAYGTESDSGDNGSGLSALRKTIRGFSEIDTCYIEPQHYDFTVMMQSTFNYDVYKLKCTNGQSVTFSPDIIMKVGPYLGWRWFFLGYTFDLKRLNVSNNGRKRELEFSIYSSQIGVDLFYRNTGSDYKIRRIDLGDGVDTHQMEGLSFDGINVKTTGFNLYYIFNHKRFSYPAAFAQSTRQKLSCGSWMVGVGYTSNSVHLDFDKLKTVVEEHTAPSTVELDSGFMFNEVRHTDFNVSCGYAYNWVFAPKWLASASWSLALAYKHTAGDAGSNKLNAYSFDNFNVDGIGRFGVVYNNNKWYAGWSAILHSNNYRKKRFATNNLFGTVNVYIGYNFGLKKKYRR